MTETSEGEEDVVPESQQMLENFSKHLVGTDGRLRSDDAAENHRRQMNEILKNTGVEILKDLSPLMRVGGYLYRQWKDPEIGKRPWRVGTLPARVLVVHTLLHNVNLG